MQPREIVQALWDRMQDRDWAEAGESMPNSDPSPEWRSGYVQRV